MISDERYNEEIRLDNYRELFDISLLKRSDDVVFVIYEMNILSTDFETIKILKKRFPKAKFVLYFTNIIGSVRTEASEAILKNRDLYDLIYTYSYEDAKKYNFKCLFFQPYCKMVFDIDERYYSDILWLGRNKGRYEILLQIQNKFKAIGLNSKIMMVDEALPEQEEPITILHQGLSYQEYIKYVIGTKCLLEVEEHGALTTRFTEAVAYGKLLLTNCTGKVDSDELNGVNQIIRFSKTNDLDKLDLTIQRKHYIDPNVVSAEGFLERIKGDLINATRQ